MAVCGTGISSISSVDGISGVILPPTQVIVEKLAEQIEFSHLAQSLRDRINVIADLENGLTQVNSLVTTETGILAQELLALKNDLTGAVAYINEQTTVDTNARQAMVASINTLMAGFDSKIAALEEKSAIQANINGSLLAEKTVKIDLAGNVAGYGLSAYMDPDGNFDSDFQVRADTFSIAPPAINSPTPPANPYHGMVWVDTSLGVNETRWYNSENEQWSIIPVKGAVPFVVKTSPETIDGITIPPGVYIDSAYIGRISANQIDTRGLVIRDTEANGGGILFGAGTALDWSKIDGQGKPADGATVGAPTGTYVGDTLAQTVESNASTALAGLGNKLNKAGNEILDVGISSTAFAKALRVGSIAWDGSGNVTSGNGVAITPSGVLAHNGTETTFAIDASTGSVYAKGELIVPDASISAAKISELAVDSLKIKNGAVTFTSIQTLTSSWTETAEKVIGYIDFSSVSSDGALLRVIVAPNSMVSLDAAEGATLNYAKVQLSYDGASWSDVETRSYYITQECDYNSEVTSCWNVYNLASVPYCQRVFQLNPSRKAYSPVYDYFWWKGGTDTANLLNSYAVWDSPSINPATLNFGFRIPSAGMYQLVYCADNVITAGSSSNLVINGTTHSLASYTYPAVPNTLSFSTFADNTYGTLKAQVTNSGGIYGFAAYIKNTATGEIVWTSRRTHEYPDSLRYVRVVAKKYGSTVPSVDAWLGVEIIRR